MLPARSAHQHSCSRTKIRRTAPATVLGGALLILIHDVATAAEWYLTPGIAAVTRYRDSQNSFNRREGSGWRAALSPRFEFGHRTPRSTTTGNIRFDTEQFSSASERDGTSENFRLNSTYNTEVSRWAIDANITRDAIISNLVEETGATVSSDITRENRSLAPTYIRTLSPTTTFSFNINLSDTSYSNAENSNLSDFTNNTLTTGLSHQWSPNTQLTGNLSLNQFDPDESNRADSDTITLQLGANFQLSETSSASLSAGPRKSFTRQTTQVPVGLAFGNQVFITDTVSTETENDDLGASFAGSLTKSHAHGNLSASISRGIFPSGIDGLVVSDRLALGGTYEFGPFWKTRLDISFSTSENTSETALTRDRETFQIRPGIEWRVKRDVLLAVNLFHTEQTFKLSGNDVTDKSTRVRPSIRWNPQPHWAVEARYDYSTRSTTNRDENEVINALYLTLDYRWNRISISR